MPRGCLIGWDFKPLPVGYVAPERTGIMELAEMVKGQVAWEKQADKIAIQAIVVPKNWEGL